MAAALVSTQTSAPQPHEVFPASSVIELCGAAVLRTAEDLNSENCGELEQGQACFVLGHGTSPDSRRLQVYVVGKGLRGWISCVAKSGRKLVTMIGPPGSDVAAGAAGEFQAIAGAAMAGTCGGSPRSGSIFSAAPAMPMLTQQSQSSACTACMGCQSQSVAPAMPMPAMPACGTMRSNHSACVGQAIQSQGAMPAMPGVGTMQSQSAMQAWSPAAAVQSQASSYSAGGCQVDMAPGCCGFSAASDAPEVQGRGNAMPAVSAPAPPYSRGSSTINSGSGGQFPPGCRVAVLDEMVMRAEESLKSQQLAVLEEGTLLDVVGSGSEPGTRRLYVRHQSGTLGWISFVAQSGRPLVALAAAEVAPPAFAAMPSTRSRSTSAAPIGTASASIFSAQEAPVEHGVSIPMPATGVASVASVASRVSSRVSYHPQVITQEVEPAGKQWLRRQKAQDLREEAPKRFLVDNRLLHAGTDGVNYRFSKDLEDIDLSCTALWGSVVEGVDEGDGWLCVSGELYLPMQLAGVPILTIEESPWALAGLQVVEAFPIGSAVLMLEAAIMRAAEDLRSTAICQLEKEQRMQILGYGAGARNRRLFVQDPVSGQDGWISFVSQTGKLLVAPLDHSPEQMQKVATMITTRQQLESSDGQGASVSMEVAQAQEEPAPQEQEAFLVDNRAFKADSDGVGYRASPDLEDKVVPARTALWGTVVHGVAYDEGWLRVGAYYLPMALKGIRVLTPEAQSYICIDPKGASTYFQPGAPSESGQDLKKDAATCEDLSENNTEREVHLPSTSLTALTQLQDSLKTPAGLLLDIADCGEFKFSELFTKMLAELGGTMAGSILQEVELLLHDHPYVTQELKRRSISCYPCLRPLQFWQERTPSKDDAVGEAIEVFVCSASGESQEQPSLALARLSKKETMVCFEDDEGGGEIRFAAVVICDRTSATQGQALARLIATTFMDEEFVSVARSAPRSPLILGALDAHLAQLTIAGPDGEAEQGGQTRVGNPQPKRRLLALPLPGVGHPEKDESGPPAVGNLLRQTCKRRKPGWGPGRNSDASKESIDEVAPPTSYFIEVDRKEEDEEEWKMERCLRQGLEVDLFVKADTPHLPKVSCHGLQLVKRCVVQDSVAIDVIASNPGTAIDAVLERLTMSGLPEAAAGQVTKALLTRARDGVQKDSQARPALVDPAQGDEACLVLTLLNDQIPASSSICAAFVRLKVALPMNFAANTPVRFLIALACHSDRENDLTEVSESLAALAVDEDLILKMARAKDASAFVAAFDSRLGEIVLLPHAHVHSRRNFEDDVLLSPKAWERVRSHARVPGSRTSGRSLFRQQGAVPQSPKSVRMKRRPSMDEARFSPSVFRFL
ncbi:nhaA [Symbiodinium sp. CCMP2592]|nr:nhaA [Symbiodinium sp. CCMP2592]